MGSIRMALQRFYRLLDGLRVLDFTAPLMMRAFLVPVFWMAGTQKLMHIESTANWFGASLGMPYPTVLAWAAALTESGGAVLLALGLGVRIIVIPLAVTMVVAALAVHWENGWLAIASSSADEGVKQRLDVANSVLREHADHDWITAKGRLVILNNGIQFAATYFIMCVSLFFMGAGRVFSLDYWLQRYAASAQMARDFPEDESYPA